MLPPFYIILAVLGAVFLLVQFFLWIDKPLRQNRATVKRMKTTAGKKDLFSAAESGTAGGSLEQDLQE